MGKGLFIATILAGVLMGCQNLQAPPRDQMLETARVHSRPARLTRPVARWSA